MFDLSKIAIQDIRNGALKEVLPELYELKEVIENNGSHNNQSVFWHILATLAALDQEATSKRRLLFLATLLHNIGKKETLKKSGDIVSFPGHEAAGAERLKTILPRFDLSDKDKEKITAIIKNHGFFHNLLGRRKTLDLNQKILEFREKNPEIFYEVILLTIADLRGGHLIKNDPEEFNFRINFLSKIIKRI